MFFIAIALVIANLNAVGDINPGKIDSKARLNQPKNLSITEFQMLKDGQENFLSLVMAGHQDFWYVYYFEFGQIIKLTDLSKL